MCDGCNFGNHPSQIYHIRSFSNPDGCMIPAAWLKKEEEGDRDEEEGKKKAEIKKEEVQKDVSPLLFGDLTTTFASFWKNFKDEDEDKERKFEHDSSKPIPLDDTRIRQCGCCGQFPLTCGRRGNRKYYEHQND